MCDLLGVTRSTFYAWKKRRGLLNSYAKHRQELSARVVEIFHSQRQCGVRTIAGRLRAEGVTVSDRLVRRIMDEHGLATSRTRSFRITTIREPGAGRDITDHLTQQFHAEHYLPGEHLVGDITYLKAGTTWLYLATVIDLSTRMILGYAVADHMRCDLISTALTKAVTGQKQARCSTQTGEPSTRPNSFAPCVKRGILPSLWAELARVMTTR